jgi:ribonuclease HI
LQPLWAEAKAILGAFRLWSATHVPRAQNAVADALANEAIDRVMAGGPSQVVVRPSP